MAAIPVFVINLDRREDRMKKMLERLGDVAFTRVPAVDGKCLEGDAWKAALDLSRNETFNVMEYACLQSHLKVCRWMLEMRLPYACIIEDDMILSGSFSRFVASDSWIPDGCELIKCETMEWRVQVSRARKPALDRHLCELRSMHAGTGGYILSHAGAIIMEKLLVAGSMAADDLIFGEALDKKTFGKIWQLVPAICIQEFVAVPGEIDSDIAATRDKARSARKCGPGPTGKIGRELLRPFRQLFRIPRMIREKRIVVPIE